MKSFWDVNHDEPPSYATKSQQGRIKSEILRLLDQNTEHYNNNGWSVIDDLLKQILVVVSTPSTTQPCGGNNHNNNNLHDKEEDDPMGRLLLGAVLSHDPPVATVEHALRAFPQAVDRNPAAFFHACQDATSCSTEIVSLLMRHQLQQQLQHSSWSLSNDKEECPYPWILSEHITLEGAQALLQVYPMGVLQPSPMLSGGYSLLDYFLLSPEMVDQRGFDMTLWSKFKLILLAAEFCQDVCCTNSSHDTCRRSIAPVHMILRRVFSTPGFFTNLPQARHVLWLMHQLCHTDRWVFEAQARDGTLALHYVLSQSLFTGVVVNGDGLLAARELIKLLLQANPAAASVRCAGQGRLALHWAIENGWPCHDLLLAVYPEALDIPDPQSELFPFQASAMHPYSTSTSMLPRKLVGPASSSMVDICDLDVTYELLRANPAHAASMQTQGRQQSVVEAHA